MHVHRNSPSIVFHSNAIINVDHHIDAGAVSCEGLINAIIHEFLHKAVKTFGCGVSNVHGRSLPNSHQTIENSNLVCCVHLLSHKFLFPLTASSA